MNRAKPSRQYLEIAVQAVLVQYSERLPELNNASNSILLKKMASEIAQKAAKLQFITENTLMEMER